MKNNARVFGLFLILILFSILTGGCMQDIQRYGMVTGIEKQNIAEYERLHADIEPEVVGMSAVSSESFNKTGIPCSTLLGPVDSRSRSNARAVSSAFGFTVMIELRVGPCWSYSSMRFR